MDNPKIYSAISSVMGDIDAIGKDKTNKQQGFQYRGIDDVMNVLHPLLVKHGVFIVPEVLNHEREERQTKSGGNLIYSICTVKYTFYAADGSSVVSTMVGEGMDSADKSSNKAMSVAYKYACFQMFCIPTEEMQDPDADTPPTSSKYAPNVYGTPPVYACEDCGQLFPAESVINGINRSQEWLYNAAKEQRGRHICGACYEQSKQG